MTIVKKVANITCGIEGQIKISKAYWGGADATKCQGKDVTTSVSQRYVYALVHFYY